ncbi:hypothetical protein [Albidovulum sp.]|uniref:hypothetical protein n=1 Tax=Albidovulum sp. TaxID=1872424 RepID=UPI0039B9252F
MLQFFAKARPTARSAIDVQRAHRFRIEAGRQRRDVDISQEEGPTCGKPGRFDPGHGGTAAVRHEMRNHRRYILISGFTFTIMNMITTGGCHVP